MIVCAVVTSSRFTLFSSNYSALLIYAILSSPRGRGAIDVFRDDFSSSL
jgi:hypothetical protein